MTRLFVYVATPMAITLVLLMYLRNMLPGTIVRAADFEPEVEVVLLDVHRADTIGHGELEEHARGTFHVLALEFTNLGHVEYSIGNGSVVLSDGRERTIGVHLLAQALHEAEGARALRSLAPGHRAVVHFCYDVPSDFPAPRVELEASAFHQDVTRLTAPREVVFENLDEFVPR